MLLNDAIQEYRQSRQARGYTKATLRSESTVLRHLLTAVGNIHVRNVTDRHVDMLWSGHDLSPATRNRWRTQLATFFKWCRNRGHMPKDNDPLEGTRNVPVMQASRLFIPVQRFGELLAMAESHHPRDRMLVALGLYAFLRAGEAAALQWQDVDLDALSINLARTKVQDRDRMPICEELKDELTLWRFKYSSMVGLRVQPHWIICPPLSRPGYKRGEDGKLHLVTPGELRPDRQLTVPHKPVQNALKEMDFPTSREGGHTLRRSGGLALYQQLAARGHDKAGRIVQAMYGHKTFSTTEKYLRLDLERKERDDILRGQLMFDKQVEAEVIELGERRGEADSGSIRL